MRWLAADGAGIVAVRAKGSVVSPSTAVDGCTASACRIDSASGNRRSGFVSSARSTAPTSEAGRSGRTAASDGAGARRRARAVTTGDSPSKGGLPASIS
jgi:hypothetical protein